MNLFLLLYLHVSIFTLLINSGSRWAAFRNILAEIFEALGLMVPNQKPSDAEEHLVGLSDDVGIGFIPDHGNQPSSSTVDRATDLTGQDETGVSKVIRADQKRFFFDLGNNNRGHFLKISEVLDELELVSKMLQVEQKLFYLDLKENPRGKYLKISEKTLGSKSTIIVPSSGISWCFNLIPLSVVGKHLEISARDYRSSNQPYGFSGFNIMATQISKKRKFVADGVFFAELNGVVLPLASSVLSLLWMTAKIPAMFVVFDKEMTKLTNKEFVVLALKEIFSFAHKTFIVCLAFSHALPMPLKLLPYYSYQTGGEDELLPLKSLLARSVFQIRVTLYNFTPNHRTFSVSTITEDLIIDNQADVV
ncbi:unnamed protein product [Brassica oleracea var. botrytis]|uniref:(rape) hypothetical protein n=1 Tax=Brassica napus TaxID=3708 RepID=A0A816UNZ2_BRANA|nr:unnamed protein product [Brassica napus]